MAANGGLESTKIKKKIGLPLMSPSSHTTANWSGERLVELDDTKFLRFHLRHENTLLQKPNALIGATFAGFFEEENCVGNWRVIPS